VTVGCPSPAINKSRRLVLPATSVTNLPRSDVTAFITLDGRIVHKTRRSEIFGRKLRFFYTLPVLYPYYGGSRRNIVITFAVEKLEWCGYPMVKIFFEDVFLWRVSTLTRDIDIAILSVRLSVRNAPVSDKNGLTYCHSFFTIR